MSILRRAVRRIIVLNGVSSTAYASMGTVTDVLAVLGVKLVVVSVGANSITYDITVTYTTGGALTALQFFINAGLIADGVDIINELLFDIGATQAVTDTHKVDSTNGRTIVNIVHVRTF